MKGRIIPYTLKFKSPAGTSRGILFEKTTFFIELSHTSGFRAYGECGVFPGLSAEYGPDYEAHLHRSLQEWEAGELDLESWSAFPSIVIGWETVLKNLAHAVQGKVFDCPLLNEIPIAINGLIWMGTEAFMAEQIDAKIKEGFRCIKMKIGSISWEIEHKLLQGIRERFTAQELELRVDANGAYSADQAPRILAQLAELEVHSIEQPIKAGQYEAMARLCAESPVAIALDEELIGINSKEEKIRLLNKFSPDYLILKPSLVGGFAGADEWIALAEERQIDWWATSALESNIGLNAIAQWVSAKQPSLPQGLGTGSLYTNNIPSPLVVGHGLLSYERDKTWHIDFPL